MNKFNCLFKSVTFFIIASVLFSCGTENSNETEQNEMVNCDSVASVQDGIDENDISYSLPSPLQIASVFKKSGMKYNEEYLSKKKEPQKYITSVSKALNLGVYSADLSYAMLNKQNQTVMEYMKLNNTVATSLGLGNAYLMNNVMKRFEKNIGNTDSLTSIISEIQLEIDLYLDENDQKEIGTIAFTGAWVESMHIVLMVNENLKSELLNKKTTQQLRILKSIINALKANVKKDAGIEKVLTSIQKLESVVDNLNTMKQCAESSKEPLVLNDDEVKLVAKEIELLRNQVINGEF
ncbi:MAG: hypothetical protein WBM13_12245 [Bacteroidia bacterium]